MAFGPALSDQNDLDWEKNVKKMLKSRITTATNMAEVMVRMDE